MDSTLCRLVKRTLCDVAVLIVREVAVRPLALAALVLVWPILTVGAGFYKLATVAAGQVTRSGLPRTHPGFLAGHVSLVSHEWRRLARLLLWKHHLVLDHDPYSFAGRLMWDWLADGGQVEVDRLVVCDGEASAALHDVGFTRRVFVAAGTITVFSCQVDLDTLLEHYPTFLTDFFPNLHTLALSVPYRRTSSYRLPATLKTVELLEGPLNPQLIAQLVEAAEAAHLPHVFHLIALRSSHTLAFLDLADLLPRFNT
ncbi:hypothetical protein JCM8097_007446 [Rhodosporidiobolus ruineniae]